MITLVKPSADELPAYVDALQRGWSPDIVRGAVAAMDELASIAQVASGSYASASEVVRAGLRALQERDAAVERWLRQEVAPAYDATLADPGRAQTMDDVFGAIRARHARALADRS